MVDTGFCVNPYRYIRVAGFRNWFARIRKGVAVIRFYIRLARTRIYILRERIICFRVECFRRDEATNQYKSDETKNEDH